MLKQRSSRTWSAVLAVVVAFGPLASMAKMSMKTNLGHGVHGATSSHEHHAQSLADSMGPTSDSAIGTQHAGHGSSCDQTGGCSAGCCTACAHCLAVIPEFDSPVDDPRFAYRLSSVFPFGSVTISPQFRPPQL